MKYQVLFSLKSNEKVFINAVCCSRDWHFNGLQHSITLNKVVAIHKHYKLRSKAFHKHLCCCCIVVLRPR